MACVYGFTLQRESSQDAETDSAQGHWIRVTCTEAIVPDEEEEVTAIFVYQRERILNMADPSAAKVHSFFSNVATPNDLAEIVPEAEPSNSDTTTPRFRLSFFEAYLPSRTELEALWDAVQEDVAALKSALSHKCGEDDEPVEVEI